MRVASWLSSSRETTLANSSSSRSRITPEQELRMWRKASCSPWTSEMKCSQPLGRFMMAFRLMISVAAARTVGNMRASILR